MKFNRKVGSMLLLSMDISLVIAKGMILLFYITRDPIKAKKEFVLVSPARDEIADCA
jgi:hypothetical protein